LLLAYLSGLTLTTLTHDWIGALPNHDHLLFGARALGLHHHAHQGDPLAQALSALESAEPTLTHEQRYALASGALVSDQPTGVVSLQPLSGLQLELNTYTALGLLALVAFVRAVAPREPLLDADETDRFGCLPAPPFPPPRFA
jgi:hypothetical protein